MNCCMVGITSVIRINQMILWVWLKPPMDNQHSRWMIFIWKIVFEDRKWYDETQNDRSKTRDFQTKKMKDDRVEWSSGSIIYETFLNSYMPVAPSSYCLYPIRWPSQHLEKKVQHFFFVNYVVKFNWTNDI